VLGILSDDQRAETIHSLGNEAIRTPALGDEPFFAWLGFTAHHDPRQAPDELR
jgi:hypothetical protein